MRSLGGLVAIVIVIVIALVRPAAADGDAAAANTPFDRGKFGVGVGGGTQTNFNTQYIWIGASVGYFVLDGVELGVSGLHEFGSGPSISELSPSFRYVAQPLVGKWPVVPYVGVFYSHWFIGGNPSVNTVGARAGLLCLSRVNPGFFVFGLGAAYEHVLGPCTSSCDSVYPDVTLGFAF
jgi:hypothetical protein